MDGIKREFADINVDPKDIEVQSAQLFSLLCILTEGEAKTIVRGQTDGFAAWLTLHKTYSRATLARTVRVLREALVPKKATTISEVIMKITEWENKVTELETMEALYKFQPMVKVALLTEICPDDVKDLIFQNMDIKNSEDPDLYKTIRDKIISWVSNRVESNYAVSIDLGALSEDNNWEEEYAQYSQYDHYNPCEVQVNWETVTPAARRVTQRDYAQKGAAKVKAKTATKEKVAAEAKVEKAEKETGEEKATTAAKATQAKVPTDTKAAASTAAKRATKQQSAEDQREQRTTSSNPRRSRKWQSRQLTLGIL